MHDLGRISLWVFLLGTLGLAVAQPSSLQAIGVDTTKADIPVDEILSGGPPPQGIPALGFTGDWQGAAGPSPEPSFISQEQAETDLDGVEPVIAFTIGGVTRAYSLQVLIWHEIANDTVGGVPVLVSFCPLCNSALAFDRRIPLTAEARQAVLDINPDADVRDRADIFDDAFLEAYVSQEGQQSADAIVAGLEVTFGVSGVLYNSNLIMFDTATSTLWAQLLGAGNVGTLTGTKLLRYPAPIVSFEEFRMAFPEGEVLSRDTGFSRRYGQNPYVGYDRADTPAFLFQGITDGRLPPKARVISISRGDQAIAYPFEVLSEVRVVNDTFAGEPIALLWREGTTSALDQGSIASSRDVGAVGVFRRTLDDRELTFRWDGEKFVDDQTGSSWNLLGQATSGELAGASLTPVVHDNTLWFSWAAFMPDTRIYTNE